MINTEKKKPKHLQSITYQQTTTTFNSFPPETMATIYDVLMSLYVCVRHPLDATLQRRPMRLTDQYQTDIQYHYLPREQMRHYGMPGIPGYLLISTRFTDDGQRQRSVIDTDFSTLKHTFMIMI